MRTVRSSLAVAKYLFAGSNAIPLTWLWWMDSVFNFSNVCPDHTTTFESRPTETSIDESNDHPKSCTSLSCPINRRIVRQFSTGGASLVPSSHQSTIISQCPRRGKTYQTSTHATEDSNPTNKYTQSYHPRQTRGISHWARIEPYESSRSDCSSTPAVWAYQHVPLLRYC